MFEDILTCIILIPAVVHGLKFELHPDINLSITETLTKYGYPVETHSVETEDGYIITVFRIPPRNDSMVSNKWPVMIVPGTCGCSENFIVNGPERGIAYYLANRGFDVWLMNTRGNRHARKHRSLNPNTDKKFWNFGWHEVAIYDTPALIDYVLNVTGKPDLYYIGHSQGTTTFFALAAEKFDYNKKIRLSIHMAPSCFLSDTRTLVKLLGKHSSLIQNLAEALEIHEVFPNRWNDYLNLVAKLLCSETSVVVDICKAILYFGQLSQEMHMESSTIPLIFNTSPARCSVKELIHYFQIVYSGEFHKFDYGWKRNIRRYGSKNPPKYNLSNIVSPVALFYAPSDNLVPQKGVKQLAATLPNVAAAYEVPNEDFNHVDFIFGKYVESLVNEPMYNLMIKYM